MKRLITTYFFLLFILLSVAANAEIEKKVVPCEQQKMCIYWWPKLAIIQGWHHERNFSYQYGFNAQAPDGFTFANAESVIYAKALYKPSIPETKSLEMLISKDKNDFISRDPNIIVSEVTSLKTGNGQNLKSFTFFPQGKGNWEQVSYGEEGEFYLIFTVSSKSEEGFTKVLDTYKQFINQYKE